MVKHQEILRMTFYLAKQALKSYHKIERNGNLRSAYYYLMDRVSGVPLTWTNKEMLNQAFSWLRETGIYTIKNLIKYI